MDKLHKITSLLLFTLSFYCTKSGYAETPSKPLWTSEDAVTLPRITPQDVASDGKHTLIQVSYISLKDNKAEKSSEWMLVDNETLKGQTIGQLNQSYPQLQFIGDGKIFSYILYNEKDKKSTLVVQDISSRKAIKVQEFKEDFYNYAFAPDGKSFAFIRQEIPKLGCAPRAGQKRV